MDGEGEMPDDLNIVKWPRWALITAAVIGMSLTGGIGTLIGAAVMNHEIRIIRIESSRFTAVDGENLVREMKSDLRSVSADIGDIKRDVAVLKARAMP